MFIDALGGLVADTGVALATEARTTFILLHEIFIMTWTGSSRHLLNSWKEEERYCSWLTSDSSSYRFRFLEKKKMMKKKRKHVLIAAAGIQVQKITSLTV